MSKLPLEKWCDPWCLECIAARFQEESIPSWKSSREIQVTTCSVNTNHIHHTAFHRSFAMHSLKERLLRLILQKAYYSHQVGLRNRTKRNFRFLISWCRIITGWNTLYWRPVENITAAAASGIRCTIGACWKNRTAGLCFIKIDVIVFFLDGRFVADFVGEIIITVIILLLRMGVHILLSICSTFASPVWWFDTPGW